MNTKHTATPLEPSNYIHLPIMVRADGDANKFHLIDANGNWLMAVLHNGEPNTYAIQKNMEFFAQACNTHDDLVTAAAKHLEWIDKERKGPVYPEGMSRESEGGETIWRKWWSEQLELCADTEALCRAALAKAGAA